MEFQNFYEHLIPAEILLDVFSFTTGIELSGFKKIHKYFGDIIDCYTKSLPNMTIQKLDIVMDYDKYLDKIVMQQTANRVIEFNAFHQLLDFLRDHPMPINELILWNTIYISKALLTIAKEVPIGRVKIQHNSKSRFYEYSAQGLIVLKGNVRQNRKLTINVLMEDYMHFIKTVHKPRHWRALNFFPPNNFECSSIQFGINQDVEYSAKELIDWVVENEMCGRPLIVERYSFDLTFPEIIHRIFMEIVGHPLIRPFTLLFKHVTHNPSQPMQTTIVSQNGMKFLAGLLYFDEEWKEYFLIGSDGQKEIGMLPDGIDDDDEYEKDKYEEEKEEDENKGGKRFDGIIQYIGIGEDG